MKVAVLDAAGVFQRTEVIDEGEFDAALHIPLDELGGACDLPAGKYRWDVDRRTFVPLAASARQPARDVPTMEQALYALIQAHPNPPADAQKWACWYGTTLDARRK